MRRLLVGLVLMVSARAAAAQTGYRLPVQFVSSGDSAFAVPSGGNLALVVAGPYDAPAASYVDVSTSSCTSAYFGESLFQITFKLAGAATDGAWFSLEPFALRDNGANDRLADGVVDVAQACHAFGIWGDLDGDGAVNSRDALATLSAAVGLPVPPQFDVAGRGDVDADGQVTSRAALAMLSASIGLSTGGFRVGSGIVDACAPQLKLPRPLYFTRGSSYAPGQAGLFGLAIRTALDTTVTIVGDSSDATLQYEWRPRVSPDGSEIVFTFPSGIWTMNADSSNAAQKLPFSATARCWGPRPGPRGGGV